MGFVMRTRFYSVSLMSSGLTDRYRSGMFNCSIMVTLMLSSPICHRLIGCGILCIISIHNVRDVD
jgi:hypothetical protein